MTELEASGVGEHPPPYMIFVVVFLFFITGLFGFLICHLLKKKGYRCRTGDMDNDEQEEEKLGENTDDENEENQDTVEQILKCIIENEANMEAFNEMLGSHNICVRHDPRLRKESIGGVPPHHHTVHSGADHTSCHLCAQVRSKKGRRQSRTPRSKHRPGEQTVFSVGRFRVTHTDKKSHGSPNPMVSSGDQLDQSQDSEERKEGGYNLRSMFKDVRPPTENANGVAPSVGKRRKSMTIFGLRRGSDPVGIKAVEGAIRETGGVKFSIQQQPVVLEEQMQKETSETTFERSTRPGSRPETELSKNQRPASPRHESKTEGYEKQDHGYSPGSVGSPKHQPTPELHINLQFKPSAGTAVPPTAPSSLQGHVGDKVFIEAFDPEPQQTSTPIIPPPGSLPGFPSVVPAAPPASCSSTGFPVIQTPPNLSSSSDLEPSFGANLALLSLSSSSPSSFQIKTPSPASSLKTSPIPSEVASSRGLTPSPKLTSGRAVFAQSTAPSKTASPLQTHSPVLSPSPKPDMRSQTLTASPADQNLSCISSPELTLESGSVMSGLPMTQGDVVSSPLEGRSTTADVKRRGILKIPGVSPSEGFKGSAMSSPSDQLSKDRLSSLPVSPSSPLSPSSPVGGRVSSVTIVKASPDSKREFSVVTMVEDEIKNQKIETPEIGAESEKTGVSPAAGQEGEVSVSGSGLLETQRAGTAPAQRPTLSQDRDDMVEMEDIRDCKVTKEEKVERRMEEEEKEMVHTSD